MLLILVALRGGVTRDPVGATMARTDSVGYHLPLSCVRVTATVAETTDAILPGKPQRSPEATVTLDVISDEASPTATITSGWVRDTNVAFKLTDDGRLVSSAVESSGELGKIVVGAVGVAATVGGVLLGMPGVGALALAPCPPSRASPASLKGKPQRSMSPKQTQSRRPTRPSSRARSPCGGRMPLTASSWNASPRRRSRL